MKNFRHACDIWLRIKGKWGGGGGKKNLGIGIQEDLQYESKSVEEANTRAHSEG